jgi:hypothetical protein
MVWMEKEMESLKALLVDENVVTFFAKKSAKNSLSVYESREPIRCILNGAVNGIGLNRGISAFTEAAPLSCIAR